MTNDLIGLSLQVLPGGDIGSNTTARIRVLHDWEADAKHAIMWAADTGGLFEENGLKAEMCSNGRRSQEIGLSTCFPQ